MNMVMQVIETDGAEINEDEFIDLSEHYNRETDEELVDRMVAQYKEAIEGKNLITGDELRAAMRRNGARLMANANA